MTRGLRLTWGSQGVIPRLLIIISFGIARNKSKKGGMKFKEVRNNNVKFKLLEFPERAL